MNKFILMIAIAIAMVLWSCERYNDDNDTGQDYLTIMNLKVGNEWDYLKYKEIDTVKFDTTQFTYHINESKKINGEEFFIFGIKGSDTEQVTINKSDGVFSYDSNAKIFRMIANYPCKVGDFFIDAASNTFNVISTHSQIIAFGKSYNTIHYKSKIQVGIDTAFIEFYMQPGIGMIKMYNYRINHNDSIVVKMVEELKEFRPGK